MKVLQIVFVLLFVFCGPGGAQAAENGSDRLYMDLVSGIDNRPKDFDFSALRYIYAKTSFYKPYSVDIPSAMQALIDDYKAGDEQAQAAFDRFYKENFVYFDAQTWYYAGLKQGLKGNPELPQWAAVRILRLLMNSGDGKTPETAYQVLSIAEEYTILKTMEKVQGYKPGTQSLRTIGGQVYDVWDVTDPATNETMELYFNITTPFNSADMDAMAGGD